jgi:hypothetical protein
MPSPSGSQIRLFAGSAAFADYGAPELLSDVVLSQHACRDVGLAESGFAYRLFSRENPSAIFQIIVDSCL